MGSIRTAFVYMSVAVCLAACGDDRAKQAAPPATLHRLTTRQYVNTIKSLLGDDVAIPAIEPDLKLYGFTSVATGELTIAPRALEQYELAARELAHQVIAVQERRDRVVGCREPSDACLRAFFSRFGRRAWRRPLVPAELDTIAGVIASAETALGGTDRWAAVEFGIALVLQAPDFLYRIELGKPAPGAPRHRVLDGFEMASRLAFVLTDAGPDDALLDAAAAGELDDEDGVRTHVAELLDQPRGREALGRFYGEYLNLDRIDEVSKDPAKFPQLTPVLKDGMRAELEAMFTHLVFDQGGDYRKIFTTDQVFVTDELAALYGVEPPGPFEPSPTLRTLPADSLRGGMMTSAALMLIYADNAASSPTRRGRFVRQNLLCEQIPPPPPGVNTSFEGVPGKTIRERLAVHRENPVCSACHMLMDPIGLAFERFDAIGQLRTEEAPGIPVDDAGEIDGVPIAGARDLGAFLARDPRVGPCFVKQFYRFATGHVERAAEEPWIDQLATDFADDGFRVKELVLRLASSPAFRHAAPPLETATAPEVMP
jgi:hypothetical protein